MTGRDVRVAAILASIAERERALHEARIAGFCPECGWTGRIVNPQHADPKTGLTCRLLSRYVATGLSA